MRYLMPLTWFVLVVSVCIRVLPAVAVAIDQDAIRQARIERIVDRAVEHERWCRESVRLGLMSREDWEADPDAASLLDEREVECR